MNTLCGCTLRRLEVGHKLSQDGDLILALGRLCVYVCVLRK